MTKAISKSKLLAVLLVLCLLVALVPFSARAAGSDAISIATGEPLYIDWSDNTIKRVDTSSSYVPASFVLYVVGTATVTVDNVTIPNMDGTYYYDDGTELTYRYSIPTSTSGTSTLVVTISSNAYGDTGTYTFTCPQRNIPTTTQYYPADVNGYLPVGQFARPNSFGWGGIYTSGTNTGTTLKFLSGYVSTGVSLGMAGGYVQFDMGNSPIMNDAKNPYGIDFIIYGNAFSTNPEAASVQVSNDGTTWYELAGSNYYTNKEHVDHLSYIKIASVPTGGLTISSGNYSSTFLKAGVYYSKDYVPDDSYNANNNAAGANLAIAKATWWCIPLAATLTDPLGSNGYYQSGTQISQDSEFVTVGTSYWPEQASNENYLNVWKMGTNASKVGGVHWCTVGSAEVITYDNVNLVPDSDDPADYQFGYADVHNNGSSYGTAVNPYTVANNNTSGNTGGDGFDLSWAVNDDGTPVSLSSVKYVRVYSSVLFNAGVFGETSAEVCGLYVTSNQISLGAGYTGFASVTATNASGNPADSTKRPNILKETTVTIPSDQQSTTLTVTSSAGTLYINDSVAASGTQKTVYRSNGTTQYLRVIAQDSTKQASITVIKVVFQ